MELFELVEQLSEAELTVREQARTRENLPELKWDSYFPVRNVNSVKLSEITIVDFRTLADRREWNADGRNIPTKTPDLRKLEIVPVEGYFTIGEREMQELSERNGGNKQLILEAAKATIPQRVEGIVDSVYRRLEWEAFRGWANGEITVKNAQTNKNYTVSLQIDSSRYVTASPAWTGGDSGTAYDNFIDQIFEAQDHIGSVSGAIMRQSTLNAIKQSAPKMFANQIQMTKSDVEERVQDEFGGSFSIVIEERTFDLFDGAGDDTTSTKIWPTGKVAFIPAGNFAGNMLRAPQARAQMLSQVPEGFVDRRGVFVYFLSQNDGKLLKVQAQANHLAFPTEQNIYVVDAGI